jgi:hypothetical protein
VAKTKKVSSRTKAGTEPSSDSGGQELTLHTSRVAAMVATQAAPRFGQVVAQSRSGHSMGSLDYYSSEWNALPRSIKYARVHDQQGHARLAEDSKQGQAKRYSFLGGCNLGYMNYCCKLI